MGTRAKSAATAGIKGYLDVECMGDTIVRARLPFSNMQGGLQPTKRCKCKGCGKIHQINKSIDRIKLERGGSVTIKGRSKYGRPAVTVKFSGFSQEQ